MVWTGKIKAYRNAIFESSEYDAMQLDKQNELIAEINDLDIDDRSYEEYIKNQFPEKIADKIFNHAEKIIQAQRPISEDEPDSRKVYFRIPGYKFNKHTRLTAEESYKHHDLVKRNNQEYYKPRYTLYKGSIGAGNKPLFIKTDYKLRSSDNRIYLKPLSRKEIQDFTLKMERSGLNCVCKELGIKKNQMQEEIVSDLINCNGTFYIPTLPIDLEDIKKIGNPLKVIKKIIKNGTTQIDDDLIYPYISDIPEIEPSLIQPRQYMPFAPHKVIIGCGGIGKSAISYVVSGEATFESSTEAGLIGFATAEKRTEGPLSGRIKQSYLDEMQEEKNEEIYGKLHSYMESGTMKCPKGIGVEIEGYSGITFQGNPKHKEDLDDPENNLQDYLTMREFTNFQNKISSNIEPFSRRIAYFLFDKNLKPISGTLNMDEQDRGIQIIRTISEGYRKEFTELFLNDDIRTWLSQEYQDKYKKLLSDLKQKCSDPKINSFLDGQMKSYRHARGMALRLAWLDVGIESMWKKGSADIKAIIKSGDQHLTKIQSRNLKSYYAILSLLNSSTYDEIMSYHLSSIKPDYVRFAVLSLLEWIKENWKTDKDQEIQMIPITQLEESFKIVKEDQGIERGHQYRSLSRIKAFMKNYQGDYMTLLGDLMLDYDKSMESFIILNKDKISKYSEIYTKK